MTMLRERYEETIAASNSRDHAKHIDERLIRRTRNLQDSKACAVCTN